MGCTERSNHKLDLYLEENDIALAHIAPPRTDLEHGLGDPISTPLTQALQEDFNPSGGSEALFSMYLDRVIEEDRKMVESWKGDAEGMLTFTGLFSAAVAALLAVSIPDIRPNSQDTSAFYLAHIYQQSSTQPNGSQPSIPSTLSDPTLPFSPPTSSVWVNGLLVSESCRQSFLRPIGDIATAVGTSLRKGCLPTLPPSKASTYSCIL